ncbi:MAG TPA: class I SAM-dependent methyltransferase, partial [Patescibacteria group bacterium]|nr:class I SAM-dependent methyltransferase [Patescibacteria group bacterium]
MAVVTENITRACKVIEMGCGAGNYVIRFSKMGYDCAGVDITENAIRIARSAALSAGADCRFFVADVTGGLSERG